MFALEVVLLSRGKKQRDKEVLENHLSWISSNNEESEYFPRFLLELYQILCNGISYVIKGNFMP